VSLSAGESNSKNSSPSRSHRFAVHGHAVNLRCDVGPLDVQIDQLLGVFAENDLPEGFNPITGWVQRFDSTSVQRLISPSAEPFGGGKDLVELYRDGERFWLLDERWGIAELNLIKGQFRSWVFPRPTTDALRVAEMAIMWPLAQLLRFKGLHLLPAVSVARDGWGALIISPFNIEPELTAMLRSGYRIVGQRWTALREEDGKMAMLHMPGCVERGVAPTLRLAGVNPMNTRVDLTSEFLGSQQNHAFCNAVFVTDPGRRPSADVRMLGHSAAVNVLRKVWPLVDLRPERRGWSVAARMTNYCRCGELQLSREPYDLLKQLDDFRMFSSMSTPRRITAAPAAMKLTLHLPKHRPAVA